MKKRLIALFLCSTLIFAMVPTITQAVDGDVTDNDLVCTCNTTTDVHDEDCPLYEKPEQPAEENPQQDDPQQDDPQQDDPTQAPAEGGDVPNGDTKDEPTGEQESDGEGKPGEEQPQCACGAEDGNHAESCPLHPVEEKQEEETDTEEEEPEEEVITETVVKVTNGVPDCAPSFSTAGPLIKYTMPSRRSLVSTYALDRLDVDDAGGTLTSGLELNKTASANTDGSYTITLEAYATGESVTTYVKDGVDIVLMLDLSNYMGKAVTTEETTTSYTYSSVNGNTKLSNLSTNSNTYFYKDGDVYYPVSITKSTSGWGSKTSYTLKYTKNGTEYTIVNGKDENTSLNQAGNGGFGQSNSVTLYTRTEKTETTTTTTYDTNDSTKLNALKNAVNNFIDKVYAQAPASRIAIVTYASSASVRSGDTTATDDALVTVNEAGVAALKSIVNGLSIAGGASNSHYAAADAVKIFQSVPTNSAEYSRQRVAILFSAGVPGTGWATENKAVLTTGNSIAQATMTQAYILKSEKGTTVTAPGGNVDGGAAWSAFSGTDIYNSTVYTGCGATFYSVGLDIPTSGDPASVDMQVEPYKAGALANEYFWRSSSHRLNGTHIFYGYSGSDQYETAVNAAFGSTGLNVYRNRKSGTTYSSLYYFYPDSLTRNQSNGYYLTTTSGSDEDLAKLNNIFSSIAGQIVTDSSSSTTLGTSTVIRDVMSPQFELPEGTEAKDITVKAYDFTGKDGEEYTFSKTESTTASGATATVEDGVVSVTGFDFSANWCGTSDNQGAVTNHGSKLVISFTVVPKDGFLGGNNVYTNSSSSGVYKDASDDEPLDIFPQPQVNVQIDKSIAQTPGTMNVYLLGNVTAADIRNGCKAQCGDIVLDLNPDAKNYGLENWQTAYVNISVVIKDANEDELTDFNNLKDDTTYSITVTVSPKEAAKETSQGVAATAKSNKASGNIHVFKPELTFKDSEVYYGGTAPTNPTDYNTNNYEASKTVWKHGDTKSTDAGVTMIGTAPNLDLTYTPESGKIANNKIATRDDIAVDVTVKIDNTDVTGKTTFVHTPCKDGEQAPNNGKFWLHVKTCQLTITKTGADSVDENQAFLFTVTGPDNDKITVVIYGNGSTTINGLKIGQYTVREENGWSWRYTCEDQTTTLTGGEEGKVTMTNKRDETKWLDGNAYAENEFTK